MNIYLLFIPESWDRLLTGAETIMDRRSCSQKTSRQVIVLRLILMERRSMCRRCMKESELSGEELWTHRRPLQRLNGSLGTGKTFMDQLWIKRGPRRPLWSPELCFLGMAGGVKEKVKGKHRS